MITVINIQPLSCFVNPFFHVFFRGFFFQAAAAAAKEKNGMAVYNAGGVGLGGFIQRSHNLHGDVVYLMAVPAHEMVMGRGDSIVVVCPVAAGQP